MGAAHYWLVNVVGIDSMSPRWAAWFAAQMERIAQGNGYPNADAVFAAVEENNEYLGDAAAEAGRRLLAIVATEVEDGCHGQRPTGVGHASIESRASSLVRTAERLAPPGRGTRKFVADVSDTKDTSESQSSSPSPILRERLALWSSFTQMMCDLKPAIEHARQRERAQACVLARAAERKADHGDDAHFCEEHDASAVIKPTASAIPVECLAPENRQAMESVPTGRRIRRNSRKRRLESPNPVRAACRRSPHAISSPRTQSPFAASAIFASLRSIESPKSSNREHRTCTGMPRLNDRPMTQTQIVQSARPPPDRCSLADAP